MQQSKIRNPRGQKKAFTAAQVEDLSNRLIEDRSPLWAGEIEFRNAALFRVAVCTMLRASDLLSLRIRDVCTEKGIKSEFTIIQKKTKKPITCYLSEMTIKVLSEWLHYNFKDANQHERIFSISDRQYQNIVQSWAKRIGLDPKLYSTHSLRRTKAKEIYAQHKNIEAVRRLLGHASVETTKVYLGVEQDEVAELARRTKI